MPKKKEALTSTDVALRGIEYNKLKQSEKEVKERINSARKPLEAYLDQEGKTLQNGSRLAVVSYADAEVHIKKTLRNGKVLLPEAIDVIRENGLEECIEDVPTIREDVLERLYEEGKVTDEILSQIYAPKPTFAFSVEVKTKMPDAPEE